MNSRNLRTLVVAGLMLGCPLSDVSSADQDKINVRFEFASNAVMDIGGFKSMPDALRAVAELIFVEGGAADFDRYIFQNARTGEKLLVTNHYGLKELLQQ